MAKFVKSEVETSSAQVFLSGGVLTAGIVLECWACESAPAANMSDEDLKVDGLEPLVIVASYRGKVRWIQIAASWVKAIARYRDYDCDKQALWCTQGDLRDL